MVIHDGGDKPKSEKIELGIKAIQGHVFAPTLLSAPMLTKGHGQTFIAGIKETYFHRKSKYDRRIKLKFSDGGQTFLDCKGNCFVNGVNPEDKQRPLLCICPGLTSSSDMNYVQNFVEEASIRGFDSCVINHRGIVGEISSPALYAWNGTQDLKEAIEYVHREFNGIGRKLMMIGVSLGANRTTCLLGELGETNLIDAACCISAPMRLWIATGPEKQITNALYDRMMGDCMAKIYLDHELQLKDRFKEETGLDLRVTIENLDPICLSALDDKVGSKFNGYENLHDYHYNAACCWSIPKIKVPTLFMSALDDPLIDDSIIDFDSVKENENCILATN